MHMKGIILKLVGTLFRWKDITLGLEQGIQR